MGDPEPAYAWLRDPCRSDPRDHKPVADSGRRRSGRLCAGRKASPAHALRRRLLRLLRARGGFRRPGDRDQPQTARHRRPRADHRGGGRRGDDLGRRERRQGGTDHRRQRPGRLRRGPPSADAEVVPERVGRSRPQPRLEVPPRKSKENQGKKLAFPCFPLAESGLFNGLQRIQIKKSGRASTRVSGCEQNGSTSQPSIISGCQRIISKLLIFAKKNQSDPRRRANVLVSGPHRLELAASRWRFNTIAFFYHSYRYSLLLLAALTAIQRPIIIALIDECSQGR